MSAAIEDTVKNCPTYLDFQVTQPTDRTIPHKIPGRVWESAGAGIFTVYNKHYLSIVDYDSKFLEIK